MADLIDRQTAIETAIEAADKWDGGYSSEREGIIRKFFDKVPAVQPTCKPMYADVSDTISRQAAIDALDVLCQEHRYKIPGKRETYSQYNEAWQDALDRAEGSIFNLPTVQPDHIADISKKAEGDCISRRAAIEAVSEYATIWMSYTDDMSASDIAQEAINSAKDTMIRILKELPSVQPDHIADIGKKVDMMYEYIYKIVEDCDGVNCYIKQGKIIRCKDCKHKHVENMVWTCPFGLPGGENFFCGYGTEPYKGE